MAAGNLSSTKARTKESTHSFLAIYRQEDNIFTISFPHLHIEALGYGTLRETKSFARDLLAEIIIDYERKRRILPTVNAETDVITEFGNQELVSIDIEAFRSRVQKDSERVFEDRVRSVNDKNLQNTSADTDAIGGKEVSVFDQSLLKTIKASNGKGRIVGILIVVLILCILIGIGASNYMKANRIDEEIQSVIQNSRNSISSQQYEQGYKLLNELRSDPNAEEYLIEIESLYNYALLKDARESKQKKMSLEEQYKYSLEIQFIEEDEFHKDATCLVKQIEQEYQKEQEKIEKQEAEEKAEKELERQKKEAEKEAAEAKERRDYLEKLATTIPFDGMDEAFIDCTACGAHDKETMDQELFDITKGDYVPHNLYYWYVDEELVMTVYCEYGKVDHADTPVFDDGSISDYWTDDEKPLFESRKKTKKYYAPDSNHNYDLDNYLTGKSYADDKTDSIKEKIEEVQKYSSLSELELEDIAWVQAYDDWLNMLDPVQEAPVVNAN